MYSRVWIMLLALMLFLVGCESDDEAEPIPPTSTPLPPVPTVEWDTQTRIFDGVEMVLVPAGCFMMGSTDEQVAYALELCEATGGNCRVDDEQPAHEICFDAPFWIDRYEVSNAQFNRLGGVAENPSAWTDDELPREQITWYEARDFCQQRDARLPTEAEWEYAARGPHSPIFPWGNAPDVNRVVSGESSGYRTAPVGSRPDGQSWVGAYDMSGNVWEWVSSPYTDYPDDEGGSDATYHVVRGGSYNLTMVDMRAANRAGYVPSVGHNSHGFRCARSDE